jgi:lupus La protein
MSEENHEITPTGASSASGGVLAQAGIPDSTMKTEEQVAPSTNTSEVKTETNGDSSDKKGASSPERKRKHSRSRSPNNRDERDWRDRRDDDNRRGGRGRGRGRGNDRRGGGRGGGNYSRNIKSNFDNLPETDNPDEIRKQVEFYFSDSNLLQDKYLLTQCGGAENKPIPVTVIHSFKRMKRFQPYSAVVAALKESSTLNITGADGAEEITRKSALPEGTTTEVETNVNIFEDQARSRSIYVKGFGRETESSQSDIEAFFAPYGPVNAVRLRRTDPEKLFKGSVFVEFDSEETAKQFLALDPKPKFEEKELKVSSKEEYVQEKAKLIEEGKLRPSSPPRHARRDGDDRGDRRGGRGGSRGRGGRGGRGGGRDRDDRGERRERRNRDDEDEKPKPRFVDSSLMFLHLLTMCTAVTPRTMQTKMMP